jgi:hypothetical protein
VSSLTVSVIVALCVLGGAFLGGLLRARLPQHHLSNESKDIIKVGIGLIATLVALVLGLLVASAKTSFDTKSDEIKQIAARVILLDRDLRRYGPEAGQARRALRQAVAARLETPLAKGRGTSLETMRLSNANAETFEEAVSALVPASDSQRSLKASAVQLAHDIAQTRWLIIEQTGSSIATPFVVVVVFWLTVIFTSLGLFAPRNGTVLAVIVLCAISVSTAVFLILELDRPFQGLITLSLDPLREALGYLATP